MNVRGVLDSEATTKYLLYEIALSVLVAVSPAMMLADDGIIVWSWFWGGAFATLLMFVASETSAGRRIWSSFERIGIGGRLVIISVVALVIWGTMSVLDPPVVPGASFLLGGATVLVVGTALRLLRRIAVDRGRQPT